MGALGGAGATRLSGTQERRLGAWDAWQGLNAAVAAEDRDAFAMAIGKCEAQFHAASVPHDVFQMLRTTSWWYRRWWALLPSERMPAPNLMYDGHAQVVALLRRYLKRSWWRPGPRLGTVRERRRVARLVIESDETLSGFLDVLEKVMPEARAPIIAELMEQGMRDVGDGAE